MPVPAEEAVTGAAGRPSAPAPLPAPSPDFSGEAEFTPVFSSVAEGRAFAAEPPIVLAAVDVAVRVAVGVAVAVERVEVFAVV